MVEKLKKKNAIILGWHNYLNVGDEAVLFCIIKIIKKNFNINNFYVLGSKKNIRFRFSGLMPLFVNNKLINKIIEKIFLKFYIKNSSLIIFGGGGIFRSKFSLNRKIKYLSVSNNNSKKIALGVSLEINKFKKDLVLKNLCLEFFRKLDLIIVRDKISYDFLKKNKLKNLYLFKDLAFLLPSFKNIINTNKPQIKTLSISLRDWHDKFYKTEEFINKLSSLFLIINKKYNFNKINLLAFCSDLKYGDTEYLKNFSEKILLRCPELRNKIKIYNTGINYFKIFNLIKDSDLVIGMRLHSQIFSSICDVPLLAFSYSEKVDNYFKFNNSSKIYLLERNLKFNLEKIFIFLNKNLFKKKKIKIIKISLLNKILKKIVI